MDSTFEPVSFLPLRTSTFLPTSNFFVPFSGADGTIRDALSDFAIATSNSLARSVLNATSSSWDGSTANLGLIPKSVSKGDFPSVPGHIRYPPSIFPRHSSLSRSLLLTKTFRTARFNVPTILSPFAFTLGL